MHIAPRLMTIFLLALLIPGAVFAQNERLDATGDSPALTVTATASAELLRVAALGQAVEIKLEIFSGDGSQVFDSAWKPGSVLDWRFSDTQGAQLADGSYRCLVTVKHLSGNVVQREGTLLLQSGQASLQPATDANGFTVVPEGATPSMAVAAHNGNDAEVSSTSGSLTFRTGNFFTAKTIEQMRLTPEGNLGIGVKNPEVKLDVGGVIRATEGVMFADGTLQTTAAGATTTGESTPSGTAFGSPVLVPNGSAAAPGFSFSNDPTTGMHYSAGALHFSTGGVSRWNINASGNFLSSIDNTFDIGQRGANRPRNVHIGGTLTTGSTADIGGSLRLGGGSYISASGTNNILLRNSALNDFNMLLFGRAGSNLFPALKKSPGNAVGIDVRLADDTNYGNLGANRLFSLNGSANLPSQSFINDKTTGAYLTSYPTGQINWSIGGVQKAFVTQRYTYDEYYGPADVPTSGVIGAVGPNPNEKVALTFYTPGPGKGGAALEFRSQTQYFEIHGYDAGSKRYRPVLFMAAGPNSTAVQVRNTRDANSIIFTFPDYGDPSMRTERPNTNLLINPNGKLFLSPAGNIIGIGGTTAASPGLKKNNAVLEARLADDSNRAAVAAAGFAPAISSTTITADYAVADTDGTILNDSTGGMFTETLPSASSIISGRIFVFLNIGTANQVAINAAASDVIIDGGGAGAGTYVLAAASRVTLQSDGVSKWYVLSK